MQYFSLWSIHVYVTSVSRQQDQSQYQFLTQCQRLIRHQLYLAFLLAFPLWANAALHAIKNPSMVSKQ